MKEFFKPTVWNLVLAVLLYFLTNSLITVYFGTSYYYLLFSCAYSWCGFVNIFPLDYFFAQVPTILGLLIAYILACTVVKLYPMYKRQRMSLEIQEKQKNSKRTDDIEHNA